MSRDSNKKQKNRYWGFILYPDSMPDDWKDILTQTGLPIAISPLHDSDKNPDDSIKKAHYHVLMCWDGPTTCACAQFIADSVNGSNVVPIASVRGMYRYHCHLDNSEKHPYSEDDRTLLNGFNIFNYAQVTSDDEVQFSKMIISYVKEKGFTEFYSLCDYLSENDLQLFNYVIHHVLYTKTILDSRRFQKRLLETQIAH